MEEDNIMKPELCFLQATELSTLIRDRDISPVEIVEALLVRIEEFNDRLHAFIYINKDRALEEAQVAEKEIQKGCYRGPLHGIPIAHKDIFDVRELPTTAASKIMSGYIASEDSTVAARLRQAGAICLGKLNLWEFASGSMQVFGEARNPWNTEMITGGSSSGSGAALAAHLIPLATGTDTGGSVRGPAHNCGIVGLRPSYGRVSRTGIIPLSWSLDQAGPMARTVSDVALFLQGMAGPDPKDPSTIVQPAGNFSLTLTNGLQGMRIALPISSYFAGADSEVVLAVQTAVKQLEKLGVSIQEVDLSPTGYGAAASWTLAYTEAFAFHRSCFARHWGDYTPAFRHKVTSTAMLTAEECITAHRIRQVITDEYRKVLGQVDAIITPTVSHPAFPIGGLSPLSDMVNFLRPVSLTGLPALSLPCGFTQAGLPIGMQLIGRLWDEGTILQIARAYEKSTDWHKCRAPLSSGPVPRQIPKSADKKKKIGSEWVMEMAKLQGLDFLTSGDAEPIANLVDPVREQLAHARQWLEQLDPPLWPILIAG
jgi:aspartyl-tRNA(Asn)/glutamyl-tRNA(Gln) amidotransferase subunit A